MVGQAPEASSHKLRNVVLLIFLVSLTVRVACVWQAKHTPISDAKHYARRAQHVLEHGGMPESAYRTPAYPYFLAGLYKYVGTDWRVPAAMNAILGALASALLVLLAATCVDVRAAALAGLLHALSPPTLALIPQTLTEHLAVPLTIGGLLLLALTDKNTGWRALLCVASSALVYGLLLLTRPAGLYLFPAWLLLVLYSPRRRMWRPSAIVTFIVVTGFVLAPWLMRNYRLGMGPFMLSSAGGINLYIGNNDDAVSDGSMKVDVSWPELGKELGEAGTDRWARKRACEWMREHPLRYIDLCRVRALGLLGAKASGYAVISFSHWFMAPEAFEAYVKRRAKPALATTWRDQYARLQARTRGLIEWYYALLSPLILVGLCLAVLQWRRFAVIVLPTGLYLLLLSLTFSQPRFRELSDPFLFILAAALVIDILCGTRQMGARPRRAAKCVLVVIGLVVAIVMQVSGISADWYVLSPLTGAQ